MRFSFAMNLVYLLLGLYQLEEVLGRAPSIFGGGCIQVKNQVYYLGGKVPISPTNNTSTKFSNQVFQLDLSVDLILDQDGEASWKVVNSDSPNLHFSSVVAEGDSSDRIFSFGGVETPANEAFRIYDVSSSSWTVPSKINENYPPVILSNKEVANNTFYYSTFLKASGYEYIHYGGILRRNDNVGLEGRASIGIYNSNQQSWSWPQNSGLRVYAHVSCLYKNVMYVVTGFNFDTQKLLPTDTVMAYDLSRAKWTNLTASGAIPEQRVGAASTLIGSKLYLVGGSSDFQFTGYPGNQIFVLDLETITWTSYTVDNFKSTYSGCMFSYNNHLVYSFGTHGYYSSSTQFINLKDFTLVNIIQAKSKSIGASIDPSDGGQAAIIGGSVAGALLLLALLLGILYLKRSKKKAREAQIQALGEIQEAYKPAEPLHEHLWVDNLNLQLEDALTFDLCTTTQVPAFDTSMTQVQYTDSAKTDILKNLTK